MYLEKSIALIISLLTDLLLIANLFVIILKLENPIFHLVLYTPHSLQRVFAYPRCYVGINIQRMILILFVVNDLMDVGRKLKNIGNLIDK